MFFLCCFSQPDATFFFVHCEKARKAEMALFSILVAFGIGLWRYVAMKDLREFSGAISATVTIILEDVIDSHKHDTVNS